MELLRLSPRTGEALRRLNVFQGQVLHGRVFRVEPISASEGAGRAGFLVKIALGSQTIEAVVSQRLGEGESVKLEVLRLSEDSLVLRLLQAETAKPDRSPGAGSARPDIAEWSETAQVAAGRLAKPDVPPAEVFSKSALVEHPELGALPQRASQVLRAAINEGFIDASSLAARVPIARAVLHSAVEQLQLDIPSPTGHTLPPGLVELSDSIAALVRLIRPMVSALPIRSAEVGEAAGKTSGDLVELSAALRPAPSIGPQNAATAVSPARQAGPAAQEGARQAPDGPTTPGEPSAASRASEPALGRASGEQAALPRQGQVSPAPAPGTARPRVGIDAQRPTEPIADLPPMESTQAEMIAPASARKPDVGQDRDIAQARDAEPREPPPHPARELLPALRVLASLAGRLAQASGWSTDQASVLSRHASRLETLADAWEGTLLAPLLTRSLDVPDAVPRLILSLFFPGGTAEFVVLRREPGGGRPSAEGEKREGGEDEGAECIGVLRLHSDALGPVSARLDYHEIEDVRRFGGRFSATGETARAMQASLPSLERALDAHGISCDGFRIVTLAAAEDEQPPRPGPPGGLDIQI
jgi:hypothetical protein